DIRCAIRHPDVREHAGDVHDPTVRRHPQVWRGGLAAQPGPAQVRVDDVVPLRRGEGGERRAPGGARVVDDNVEPTATGDGRVDQRGHRPGIGDVGGEPD